MIRAMSSTAIRFGRAGGFAVVGTVVGAVVIAGCAQASSGTGAIDASADATANVDGSVPIDAPGAPIDAPGALPDAPGGGCTVMTRDLLVNGNFDATPLGTGWVETLADPTLPVITPDGTVVHSAPNKAWMGGLTSATDALHQDVAVPASTTSLVLTGQYQIRSGELFNILPYDFGDVALTTSTNTVLQAVLAVDNTDAGSTWVPISFTFAQPHAGQTVRLRFATRNDSSGATSFYFDSLALTATYCE